MSEELSYQIMNISAVNEGVFSYYYKFVKITKEEKTLVLAIARKENTNFFEFT